MSIIKKIKNRLQANHPELPSKAAMIESYKKAGSIPWSLGYNEHKWEDH